MCLSIVLFPLHRLSLIEPGPVHTEFEAKMIQDVKQKEYPGTDPDTLHYFKNVYLPSSVDIFETLGQTPDDVARVRLQTHCLMFPIYPFKIENLMSYVVHPLPNYSAPRKWLKQAGRVSVI